MAADQPIVAQTAPIAVDLEAGKTVWWCACGRSQNQPYCDGSHKVTSLTPVEFTPDRGKTYYLCCCKQSKSRPICDGTHNTL